MSNKHFGTLRDRIHLYTFVVAALILCFQFVQASAYESLKLAKWNPDMVQYSQVIQLGASMKF